MRVVDKSGEEQRSAAASRSFITGVALSAADAERLTSLVSSLETECSIDKVHYTLTVDGVLPAEGTSLGDEPTEVVYTWAPVR